MGFCLQLPNSQEGAYIKPPVMKFLGIFVLLVVLTFEVVNAQDGNGLLRHTVKDIMENPKLLTVKNVRDFVAKHPNQVVKVKKLVEQLDKKNPKVLALLKKHLESINKDAENEIEKYLR